jgi:hypothetical protein
MIEDTMATWHKVVENQETGLLEELLADDVVFHSPVVHTPQEGKAITLLYLTAAAEVLGGDGFHYVREVIDGRNAVLEFKTEIGGIQINGVDMIHWDEQGQIDDFKVMVRPLKAINLLHRMMGEMLEKLAN